MARASTKFDSVRRRFLYSNVLTRHGQVAQLVERGPEKAGVGGSIPSLATISFNNLASVKTSVRISRAYNTRTSTSLFSTLGVARSIDFQVSQPVLLALAMCCRTSLSSALSSLGTQDLYELAKNRGRLLFAL